MTRDPGTPPNVPGDDDLARLLGRLRDVDPASQTSVSDALVDVEHRVRRHETRVRAGAGLLAAAAAVILIAIPAIGGGAGNSPAEFANGLGPAIGTSTPVPTGSNRPPATPSPGSHPTTQSTTPPRTNDHPGPVTVAVGPLDVTDDLGCPVTWGVDDGGPWVPEAGASDALIGTGPTMLVVCSYPGNASATRGLSAGVSIHHGFAGFTDALLGAAKGRLTDCPTGNGAIDYLVRAYYADGTTSWVTVTGCTGASNGSFTTGSAFASGLAGAIAEQGSWGAPYPGNCSDVGDRPGRESAMVPGATDDPPVLGYLCVASPDTGQRSETTLTGDTLSGLVGQIGAVSAASGSQECQQSDGQTYLLVLVYEGGENVAVRIIPDCTTGLSNGELVGVPPDDFADVLGGLTTS